MYIFSGSNEDFMIFMGEDKYENEKLIKWGWPEDVWFHVDDLSSAHVYVRLPPGYTIDNIPQAVLNDCCQLTKGNSIEGCKKDSVEIVYTEWSNLKKDIMMDTGTIGFKNYRAVKKIRNVTKEKALLNKLEKTRKQVTIDFEAARNKRDREALQKQKETRRAEAKAAKAKEEADRLAYRQKHYLDFDAAKGDINTVKGDGTIDDCRQMEEDFM
eukprot:Blabericola_migrator_1__11394@NODE_675_length_6916_cov_120_661848_g486_i1_p4_GENE_NODE_675_length_6916_cov_120_661848_g486_i1NODE_675_length_6916_cov_120_661848_g486_i1_p4_ORF_typecomplete_len213_score60_56NFACTR_1/PF05670_13/2_2e39NFACTR_2/PF18297_1/0_00065NFACTR_2/PF18297_1/2_5e02MCU/PF04678_13/0_34DUF1682/PF07946_14/4_5GTA_holin_3TM/PF11351_8/9_7_NODE_675_length_6916_cov_120_661848_g486_i162446882